MLVERREGCRTENDLIRSAEPVSCLTSHGFHILLTYQPTDRFWVFQGIETSVFVALAAGLVALAYRMVVTRNA